MTPVAGLLQASVDEGGKRWTAKEEAMDVIREAETGEASGGTVGFHDGGAIAQ